jgi:hypothetical protein
MVNVAGLRYGAGRRCRHQDTMDDRITPCDRGTISTARSGE